LTDFPVVFAVGRLGRRLETATAQVVFPAVIGTADAFVIDPAISQGCEAVSALLGDQAIAGFRFIGAGDRRNTTSFSPRSLTALIGFSAVSSAARDTGCQ
jgi:hypothetical protein